MADKKTGGKKGKTEIQKFEYLENKKSFWDEIKSFFHNYLKAAIWWKNEKRWTQSLSSILTKVLCIGIICNVTMSS